MIKHPLPDVRWPDQATAAQGRWFQPILYGELILIGILVGVEIPLLLRILKDELDFKDLVAKVLSFDYAQQPDGGTGALYVLLKRRRPGKG